MKSVFIGGIPASGKSFLAKKLSSEYGISLISTDLLRENLVKDPKTKYWVNFYWNLDEKEYYTTTSCEEQWGNLVHQSEAFWPEILRTVGELSKNGSLVVEGVNVLPHLAAKDFNFSGVYLLGESQETILSRIKKDPRWGKTDKLQQLEAHNFFNCERDWYKKEAEKHGYLSFDNPDEAYKVVAKMIQEK